MKNIKFYALLSALVMVMVACSKEELFKGSNIPTIDPSRNIVGWGISDNGKPYLKYDTEDSTVITPRQWEQMGGKLECRKHRYFTSNEGMQLQETVKQARSAHHVATFAHNHYKDTVSYNVVLVIMSENGSVVEVRPLDSVYIDANFVVISGTPATEEDSRTTYSLSMRGNSLNGISDFSEWTVSQEAITVVRSYVVQIHKIWNNVATLVNGNIAVDGVDSVHWHDVMSNGDDVINGRGIANHRSTFSFTGMSGEFNEGVVGNCYDFVNGVANCLGKNVTCQNINHVITDASVVLSNGKNVKDSLHACQTNQVKICFEANGVAKVHFDAPAVYTTTYTTPTPRTRTGITPRFRHLSFNSAVDETATQLIPKCSNRVKFIETYNIAPLVDSSHVLDFDFHFPFNYTVSGTLYQSQIGDTITFTQSGNTFTAHTSNNSCVVTLVKQARTCDNIMYDGTNYKSQAEATLDCNVSIYKGVVKANGIDILFNHNHGSNRATGHINRTINPDPTEDLWGTTLGLGITRADRDDYGNGERWLHSLQENSGSYRIYYKRVDISDTWAYQDITAAEAAAIQSNWSSTVFIARVYNHSDNSVNFLSMVDAQQYSSGQYKVRYWDSFSMSYVYNFRGDLGSTMSSNQVTEHPVYSVDLTGNAGVFTVTYGNTYSVQ